MKLNEKHLLKLLSLPIKKKGYHLLEIKCINQGAEKIIQLFIFRSIGIEIEDCIKVNNIATKTMINSGLILDDHTLEISSPGIFMKLNKPEHFQIFKGKKIKVKLHHEFKGIKIASGNISSCTGKGINLELVNSREDIHIPFSKICKANLEPEIMI